MPARAFASPVPPPPAPPPVSRGRRAPVELLTVSRKVLLFTLKALQASPSPTTDQKVAVEMIRRELGA